MHYVYFLHSTKTGEYYVGQTSKTPLERLAEHNNGESRYTNQYRPYVLVCYESYFCRSDAEYREQFYKTGIGKQIRKLILDYFLFKSQTHR